MIESLDDVQQQLNQLRQIYKQQLSHKIQNLTETAKCLLDNWHQDDLILLHRLVHTLAGSSATFGWVALGCKARELEILLETFMSTEHLPTSEQKAHIMLLVAAIQQTLNDSYDPPLLNQQETTPIQENNYLSESDNRLVFVVDDDDVLAQDLALQIGYFGYTVRIFNQSCSLKEAVLEASPAAIIMNIVSPEGELTGAEIIAEIHQQYFNANFEQPQKPIPFIFISYRGDFTARLYAVRAGGYAFFTKPINISELIDQIDWLIGPRAPAPYRILIIEDDIDLAQYLALHLQRAGMLVEIVTNPIESMQPLSEFDPDLILMDVYMPNCNGLELAAIIRQQQAYVSVPIVFLSTETDQNKQLAAMSLGGDDFLTKPIQPQHLISAVATRAQRSATLRAFMERDSLTGLLNHTKLQEQLDAELRRVQKQGVSLAFVMIDIDHFKLVNDTYGHPTGDRVIKSLAHLLRRHLRHMDIIGRYGGEEFGVILPGVDGPTAVKMMDQIREGFAQVRHQSKDKDFSVTFSSGIATFPDYTDALFLSSTADQALYEAKRQGRNCVVLAQYKR